MSENENKDDLVKVVMEVNLTGLIEMDMPLHQFYDLDGMLDDGDVVDLFDQNLPVSLEEIMDNCEGVIEDLYLKDKA